MISDLLLEPESASPAGTEQLIAPAARRVPPGIVHTSLYVPKPAHRKLKEIALVSECKVHDLILRGIDAVLLEHGHPTTAELRAKAP